MDKIAFVKYINSLRLANKGKWYTFIGTVEGKKIEIKGYGTWLQIFRVDGVNHANCCDRKVGQFKQDLTNAINYATVN